jgi:hypothetical protein
MHQVVSHAQLHVNNTRFLREAEAVVDLDLMIAGNVGVADELRSLRARRVDEDELRGCIRTVERPPKPDTLGPVLDALQIVAGPAAAVVSAALIAWVKSRSGNVKLVLKLQRGGSAELDASQVRSLDAEALADLTERVTRLVGVDSGATGHCLQPASLVTLQPLPSSLSGRHADRQGVLGEKCNYLRGGRRCLGSFARWVYDGPGNPDETVFDHAVDAADNATAGRATGVEHDEAHQASQDRDHRDREQPVLRAGEDRI